MTKWYFILRTLYRRYLIYLNIWIVKIFIIHLTSAVNFKEIFNFMIILIAVKQVCLSVKEFHMLEVKACPGDQFDWLLYNSLQHISSISSSVI